MLSVLALALALWVALAWVISGDFGDEEATREE